MNMVRPVSDLRNNFAEISRVVNETNEPVILTKNGYGNMVVLSMEAYNNLKFENEVYFKLLEIEQDDEENNDSYTSDEIIESVKEITNV